MIPRRQRRGPWVSLRTSTQRLYRQIREKGVYPILAGLPLTLVRKFRREARFRLAILALALLSTLAYTYASSPRNLEPILFPPRLTHPEVAFRQLREDIAGGKVNLHPIENGQLVVDRSSTIHPIEQLIITAQEEWERKVASQSRTLKEAVRVYEKRYGRSPPLGFDKWWKYVVDNEVVLPDEYDRINNDIDLYWSFPHAQLRSLNDASQIAEDTYTLRVKDGTLTTFRTFAPGAYRRAVQDHEQQLELIRPVIRWLPDVNITFTLHDHGHRTVSWQHRMDLKSGKALEEGYKPWPFKGFELACPPDSPMAKTSTRYSARDDRDQSGEKLSGKTFTHTTKGVADICQHPEYEDIHGTTARRPPSHGDSIFPQVIFALSKTSTQVELQGASLYLWTDHRKAPYIPWRRKYRRRAVWRGAGTGQWCARDTLWRDGQRFRLVNLTMDWGDEEVDLILPRSEWTSPTSPSAQDGANVGINTVRMKRNNLSEALFDFGFATTTGKAVLCSEGDGTCDTINEEFPHGKYMDRWDAAKYRYIVDVDGNGWSGRFQQLLLTGSVILKSSMVVEWWHDRLQPWVHYVPINIDYSDLYDTVAYLQSHDERARAIGQAAREWTTRSWRKVDLIAYNFRLYLEWARLLSDNRESLVYDPRMEQVRRA